MGSFIDRIRAKREMERNPYSVKINAQDIEAPMFTSNYTFTKPVERTPVALAPIQDWQKYGFKSQDDMNFWINRAKSWTGGILDSIDKVRQFQRENNLIDDGKVGWRTIEVFNKLRQSKKNSTNTNNSSKGPVLINKDEPANNVGVVNWYESIPLFGDENIRPYASKKTIYQRQVEEANRRANENASKRRNNQRNVTAEDLANMSAEDVYNSRPTIGNANTKFVSNPNFYKQQFGEIVDLISRTGNNRRNDYMFLHKKGGIIKRFQDGGQMDDFIMFVAECIGAKDEKSLNEAINQLGEKGINMLKQAYKKGMSPEQVREMLSGGMQSSYMKKGGCIACEMNKGGRLRFTKPELQKANAKANVNQLPVMVNSLKCGGKAKKKLIRKK